MKTQPLSLDSEDDFRSAWVVETSVTSLFRTILTRAITQNELLILLGSNHLRCGVSFKQKLSKIILSYSFLVSSCYKDVAGADLEKN